MKRILVVTLILLLCGCHIIKLKEQPHFETSKTRVCRIMFYNTENLLYPTDDTIVNDDDFVPDGVYHWTFERYKKKLTNIYKVMTAVGEGEMPDIVGFCEIENKKCLQDMIYQTPLLQFDYKIIHFDSPDPRGIDVGLIYKDKSFTPIYFKPIQINFPKEISERKTRDILFVKGIVKNTDTISIFINHWPSKRGGAVASDPLRMFVAKQLKYCSDTLLTKNPNAKILIIGDFNDEPDAMSINEGLGCEHIIDQPIPNKLYNLSYDLQFKQHLWTNKFQDHEGIIDQIIVSGAFLSAQSKLQTSQKSAHVFQADFLFMEDDKYLGQKLFRTYIGMNYKGGFSDHLPVYIDILK